MIDLYIFDVGGVMIRNFMVVPEMAGRFGMGQEAFKPLVAKDMHEFSCGRIDSGEYWRRFAERTGMPVPENYWETLFRPEPMDGSFELVRELSLLPSPSRPGATVRVVAGTNTIDCHHRINRMRGFYDVFDAVYASNEIGFAKPDPAFWLHILKAEGVSPENAFFTDDSPDYASGAVSLGIRTRVFTDPAALRRGLAELGVPVGRPGLPVEPAARTEKHV